MTQYSSLFSGLHRQAAINLNHLAGNVTRVIGKQEAGDAGYFICFGETPEGNLFENFYAIRFIERAGHVGSDHSQGESINCHLATGDFLRECFR